MWSNAADRPLNRLKMVLMLLPCVQTRRTRTATHYSGNRDAQYHMENRETQQNTTNIAMAHAHDSPRPRPLPTGVGLFLDHIVTAECIDGTRQGSPSSPCHQLHPEHEVEHHGPSALSHLDTRLSIDAACLVCEK